MNKKFCDLPNDLKYGPTLAAAENRLRERAVELAARAGRTRLEVSYSDYMAAKNEFADKAKARAGVATQVPENIFNENIH